MKKKEWQPTNHSKCCIKKLFMFHLYQFEGWVLKAPPLCHMALLSKCNWQKSLTWATKYCCPPRPSILCTPFHLYIGASRSKVGLHIVLVKAEYSVFIKYITLMQVIHRKNNGENIQPTSTFLTGSIPRGMWKDFSGDGILQFTIWPLSNHSSQLFLIILRSLV